MFVDVNFGRCLCLQMFMLTDIYVGKCLCWQMCGQINRCAESLSDKMVEKAKSKSVVDVKEYVQYVVYLL